MFDTTKSINYAYNLWGHLEIDRLTQTVLRTRLKRKTGNKRTVVTLARNPLERYRNRTVT